MERHRAASEPHKLTRNAKAKGSTNVSELSGVSVVGTVALQARRLAQTAEQVKTEQGQAVQLEANAASVASSSLNTNQVIIITPATQLVM